MCAWYVIYTWRLNKTIKRFQWKDKNARLVPRENKNVIEKPEPCRKIGIDNVWEQSLFFV